MAARAVFSANEDPLVQEKSPRERLRRNFWIEVSTARAVPRPLERPASWPTRILFPSWACLSGLGFNPRFLLVLLVFINFQHRILLSFISFMGFSLKFDTYGLFIGSRYLSLSFRFS